MKLLNWLAGMFSRRGKALLLYRRGMERANRHDGAGAIEDYKARRKLERMKRQCPGKP